MKNPAEALLLGALLQSRTRIGDGDEVSAGALRSYYVGNFGKEIIP